MRTTNQLERHSGGTFYRVKSATGGTEATVIAERYKLGVSAFATAVKSTAKGWISAMDHLRNVFHFHVLWMTGVFDYFVMIAKNVL